MVEKVKVRRSIAHKHMVEKMVSTVRMAETCCGVRQQGFLLVAKITVNKNHSKSK